VAGLSPGPEVKGLLKIVLGAFALFMALSIAQEWQFFSSAWFGEDDSPLSATETDREEASETVRRMLTLMRHFYSSGGDPRFAERMMVSDGIREEIAKDVAYLKRNNRVQDPRMMRLEVASVESVGADLFEVRTREFWQVRFFSAVDGEPSDEPVWQINRGRYLTRRGSFGWSVESWETDFGGETAAEANPS
jgi:hypothetical protein